MRSIRIRGTLFLLPSSSNYLGFLILSQGMQSEILAGGTKYYFKEDIQCTV